MPDGPAPRATSYDVAREAGVSQSTVSRAFKPRSPIPAPTRARVFAAAERLGYMPNALARSLITRRSDLIAVIATRYTLRFNPDVTHALGESLNAAGKQLLLLTVEHDLPSPAALRRLLEYPLGGVISCVLLDEDSLGALRRRGIPIVLYNRVMPGIGVDTVSANHEAASHQLAAMLYRAGHRRFLCMGGPADAVVSRLRMHGALAYLASVGADQPHVIETDYSYAAGRAAFLAGTANHRPDAVICANDQIAMGVMDACRFDRGWRVPEDVSVVGFDDVAEAERPSYALTTMRQESVAMAHEAVRLLLARTEVGGDRAVHVTIPACLMARGSARIATA